MASPGDDFKDWLTKFLNELHLDGEVYGEYIVGTLSSLEETENKKEAITEILEGVASSSECERICYNVLEQWSLRNPSNTTKLKPVHSHKPLNLEEHIIKVTSQAPPIAPPTTLHKEKNLSDEEKRKVLMVQYGDNEDDVDDQETNEDVSINMNKLAVSMMLKEQKEEQKVAHKKKQEIDKRNRELQQQRQLERKEKEKKRTQKQERKR